MNYVPKRAGQRTCRPDLVILIVGVGDERDGESSQEESWIGVVYDGGILHMCWFQSIQGYHLLLSVNLRSKSLVIMLHNLIRTIIRLLQGASYRIVTYKDVCTMLEIFAYVGLVLGVIARWRCSQTLHGGSELGNVIPWI